MSKIYEGIRVLEISDEKGMYCGKLLAQAGMEVIKIESPEGDPMRLCPPFAGGIKDRERSIFWLCNNAGKKSVTLDITSSEGQETFRKLAKTADVVLETLEPGKMAEYGLSYEDLTKENAGLVMCSITNFGQDGPYAHWNASSEMIPFAIAGNMGESGKPGFNYEPLSFGRNVIYNGTCVYAATAILAGLRKAKLTGEGTYIDAAVIEACGLWKNESTANPQRFPYLPDRRKAGSNGPFPPDGLYQCSDGSAYVVGMARWSDLCDWCIEKGVDVGEFGNPEYRVAENDNPHVVAHGDEIRALLSQVTVQYTKKELYEEGIRRHIPVVPMNSPQEVCEEPHYQEREYFVELEHPVAGKAMYPGAPAKLTRTPMDVTGVAPLLGADNEAILGNL
ncbi:MAG: CoA transferase [Parasporobacterium sp.]|nr:CoA transferase [Parasporobacterium sp.]